MNKENIHDYKKLESQLSLLFEENPGIRLVMGRREMLLNGKYWEVYEKGRMWGVMNTVIKTNDFFFALHKLKKLSTI